MTESEKLTKLVITTFLEDMPEFKMWWFEQSAEVRKLFREHLKEKLANTIPGDCRPG